MTNYRKRIYAKKSLHRVLSTQFVKCMLSFVFDPLLVETTKKKVAINNFNLDAIEPKWNDAILPFYIISFVSLS